MGQAVQLGINCCGPGSTARSQLLRARQYSCTLTACFRNICSVSSHCYLLNFASSVVNNVVHFFVHITSDLGP